MREIILTGYLLVVVLATLTAIATGGAGKASDGVAFFAAIIIGCFGLSGTISMIKRM